MILSRLKSLAVGVLVLLICSGCPIMEGPGDADDLATIGYMREYHPALCKDWQIEKINTIPSVLQESSGLAISDSFGGGSSTKDHTVYHVDDGGDHYPRLLTSDSSGDDMKVVNVCWLEEDGSDDYCKEGEGLLTDDIIQTYDDEVKGNVPLDIEDLSMGSCGKLAEGSDCLFVADTGRGFKKWARKDHRLYIIREKSEFPKFDTELDGEIDLQEDVAFVQPLKIINLKFPINADGKESNNSKDIEAMSIHPNSGNLYFITKNIQGDGSGESRLFGTKIYKLAANSWSNGDGQLVFVGEIDLPKLVAGNLSAATDDVLENQIGIAAKVLVDDSVEDDVERTKILNLMKEKMETFFPEKDFGFFQTIIDESSYNGTGEKTASAKRLWQDDYKTTHRAGGIVATAMDISPKGKFIIQTYNRAIEIAVDLDSLDGEDNKFPSLKDLLTNPLYLMHRFVKDSLDDEEEMKPLPQMEAIAYYPGLDLDSFVYSTEIATSYKGKIPSDEAIFYRMNCQEPTIEVPDVSE